MEYDSLESVKETIGNRVSKSVARATKLQLRSEEHEIYALKYHHTDVVTYSPEGMTLESGGWRTTTTKERMNRFSHANIWTRNWLWYVDDSRPLSKARPYSSRLYFDGMQISWEGEFLNPLSRMEEDHRIKGHEWILRRIDDFAGLAGDMYMNGEQIFPDLWGTLSLDAKRRAEIIAHPEKFGDHSYREVIGAFAREATYFDVALALGINKHTGRAFEPRTMYRDMLMNMIKKGAKRNLTRWEIIQEPYEDWLVNS